MPRALNNGNNIELVFMQKSKIKSEMIQLSLPRSLILNHCFVVMQNWCQKCRARTKQKKKKHNIPLCLKFLDQTRNYSKRSEYNNKDEDNTPKTLNDKNHQSSSQKFRQQNCHHFKFSFTDQHSKFYLHVSMWNLVYLSTFKILSHCQHTKSCQPISFLNSFKLSAFKIVSTNHRFKILSSCRDSNFFCQHLKFSPPISIQNFIKL